MSGDESDNGRHSVYYKDKAQYNQALLDAIKDARKQRVEDPGRGFPNAVLALENILFKKEKDTLDLYKYDPRDHSDEVNKAKTKAQDVGTRELAISIYLNEIKALSWPLYRKELSALLKDGVGPDLTFDDTYDRMDARILLFEALLNKIIEVLQSGGWLTWEAEGEIAGGGGAGLTGIDGPEGIDDDLNFSGG